MKGLPAGSGTNSASTCNTHTHVYPCGIFGVNVSVNGYVIVDLLIGCRSVQGSRPITAAIVSKLICRKYMDSKSNTPQSFDVKSMTLSMDFGPECGKKKLLQKKFKDAADFSGWRFWLLLLLITGPRSRSQTGSWSQL